MRTGVERWLFACSCGLIAVAAGCGDIAPARSGWPGDMDLPPGVIAELERASDPATQDAIIQAWRARGQEATDFLARRSRGWRVVDTRRSKTGQVFDYVAAETLYPGAPNAPFASPPAVTGVSADVGAKRAVTEFEADPALTPPRGTIPVVRPHLEPYVNGDVRARDLGEYMARAWPNPSPLFANNRLYGAHIDARANIGTAGNINIWDYQQVAFGEMSLLQTAALCRGGSEQSTMEAIEVGFQKLPSMYGDNNVHLFTFFRTAGGATGDRVGGYNMDVQGFIQAADAPFPPGAGMDTSTFSTLDGQQYECKLEVQLFQGNWWVFACGSWIGYFPTPNSTSAPGSQIGFDLIGAGTCEIEWYGELFDPDPATWTNADMGSGRFAAEGFARAAFVREPFLIHSGAGATWFSSSVSGPGNGYDPDCYSLSPVFASASPGWGTWFFVGGPGGDHFGCN